MRKNLLLSLLSVLLALVLLAAATHYQSSIGADRLAQTATLPPYTGSWQADTETPTEPARADAPDVRFYDAEGKPVQLSDFKGKPVVLHFWESWSSTGKAMLPVLMTAYETYKDQVSFLMVNVTDGTKETIDSAKEYWDSLDTELPVYLDTDADAAAGFQVSAAPASFFISATGKSVAYAPGELTRENLEQGIRMCMNESNQ